MLIALIVILVIILAILGVAAMRPDGFSLSRSAEFHAPPEKVFAELNDFRNWAKWSPWEPMDPNLQRNYSGASSGKGAKYAWVGNKKVGEGNMEITKSVSNSSILLDLNFLKPFKASNVTEFTIVPHGKTTKLTWEMRGPTPFMMKIMHLFMNMDKMVGKDFEKGLANLKSVVEK
ncbi:MAG: SRPBCC family protein [Aestuariivirga sp.]